MTKVFLSSTASTVAGVLEQTLSQMEWADGLEVRVDLLDASEQASLSALPAHLHSRLGRPLELICTVRRTSDGGRSTLPDTDRIALLAQAVESGYTYVDLEADLDATPEHERLVALADERGVTVIRSMHDFTGVPDDLAETIRSLPRSPREIPKAAVMPRSTRDLVRVVNAAKQMGVRDHIVLGMGEFGFPTRVLGEVMGNFLTFASAAPPPEADGRSPHVSSAAPGHVSPETLDAVYRVRTQGPATRYFAVIGDPISHSRSPQYHNARFADEGIDACYVPVRVDDVDAFFDLANAVPLLGCSVTIPHKQAVIRHLCEAGDDVAAAQACNTVVRVPDGWRGINTDVLGFLAPLEEVFEDDLAAARVLVLGAGGAARGVVYALLSRGARVSLWNRTAARAEQLAAELSRFAGRGRIDVLTTTTDSPSVPDIVVNTTSVGMHGDGDPAAWYELRGHEIVYDIVYTPPDTPLIRRALEAGCRVVTGDRMFAAQAAAQFELYRVLATAARPDA